MLESSILHECLDGEVYVAFPRYDIESLLPYSYFSKIYNLWSMERIRNVLEDGLYDDPQIHLNQICWTCGSLRFARSHRHTHQAFLRTQLEATA